MWSKKALDNNKQVQHYRKLSVHKLNVKNNKAQDTKIAIITIMILMIIRNASVDFIFFRSNCMFCLQKQSQDTSENQTNKQVARHFRQDLRAKISESSALR